MSIFHFFFHLGQNGFVAGRVIFFDEIADEPAKRGEAHDPASPLAGNQSRMELEDAFDDMPPIPTGSGHARADEVAVRPVDEGLVELPGPADLELQSAVGREVQGK